MEPPQGSDSPLAFFFNHTDWRLARLSIFPQPRTRKCRLCHRHFCRDVSGNRHGRYPASSAPHRTAKSNNLGFSSSWIERELVRKTTRFIARREERVLIHTQ